MVNLVELEELRKICEDRKINPEQLLEEKINPLQKKISSSQGELIGAITRFYKPCSHGMKPVHYMLKETLYTGIITSKTRFPKDSFDQNFLLGIDKSYLLEINNSVWENDFENISDGNFGKPIFHDLNLILLYFMEKPAKFPKDSWEHGCYGSYSTCSLLNLKKKPRLELSIGDEQTIPLLQKNLDGWRYLQFSELLGYELPVTDQITKKIEKEQLKIFNEIKSVQNNKDQYLKLLNIAIKRGYHENGLQVEKKLDTGIILKIDLKDFFTQRKNMYGL